jgi:hypothetical protein
MENMRTGASARVHPVTKPVAYLWAVILLTQGAPIVYAIRFSLANRPRPLFLRTAFEPPQAHGVVYRPRGRCLAIGGDGDRGHRIRMIPEDQQWAETWPQLQCGFAREPCLQQWIADALAFYARLRFCRHTRKRRRLGSFESNCEQQVSSVVPPAPPDPTKKGVGNDGWATFALRGATAVFPPLHHGHQLGLAHRRRQSICWKILIPPVARAGRLEDHKAARSRCVRVVHGCS